MVREELSIVEVAKSCQGLSQSDALVEIDKRGLRLLTNKEIDAILQDDKLREKYNGFFPIWTGTRIELDGEKVKIVENGKTVEKTVPEEDGWFEQDEFGLPFGKPSEHIEKEARYLYRFEKYSGLVFRWYGSFDGGRRVVGCYGYGDSTRLGVLATPMKEHRHKWKTVCEDCGEKRGD